MTTYEIPIGYDDGWIAVVPLGTYCYVHNTSTYNIRYRFGIDSDSSGIPMGKGDYIKIEEVVYIKNATFLNAKITVVGD